MDWLTLIIGVVGIVIGGLITWGVTFLYSQRQERTIAGLPEHLVEVLIQRGLLEPENEGEAKAAARSGLSSWWASSGDATQADMNQGSYQDYEKADFALRHVYERLRIMLQAEDLERLDQTQEAWRAFRDKQVRLAGGFYEGGSVRPLIHNMEAVRLTEARTKELELLYNELRSR